MFQIIDRKFYIITQENHIEEVMDSVMKHLITNEYVYFEYIDVNQSTISCELFTIEAT